MIKKLTYLALGMMASSVAMAAGGDELSWSEIEEQAQNSGSVTLLAKLYGSWVLHLFGSGGAGAAVPDVATPVTVFAALVGVTGWTLFMILAGYVGVVGLIRTAQQGEFLGREWDTTWVLARLLGALILSAPLGGAGESANLAAGQTLVIRAAVVSSSAADIIWGKTLTAIGQERIRTDKTMQVDIGFTIQQAHMLVSKGETHGECWGTHMRQEKQTNPSMTPEQERAADNRAKQDCQMDRALWSRERDRTRGEVLDDFSNGVRRREGDIVIGSIDTWYKGEEIHRARTIQSTARAIAETYYTRGWAIGNDFANDRLSPEEVEARLASLAQELHSAMKAGVETILQSSYRNSAALYGSEARKYGWVSAGNYYRILATQQTAINSALGEAVAVGGPGINPESLTSGLANDDLIYHNVQRSITRGEMLMEASGMQGAADNVDSFFGTAGSLAGDGLSSIGMNPLSAGEDTDPLVVAANIGHSLSTLAQWGGIASSMPFASKVMAVKGDTIKSVLVILLILGVFLGDIIPSLPWVYFLFGTIAWLVHVTEMFVSAPLWIAAHAAPEGSNHTSNLAAKGYNNMLYVMLYPVLAIGGFIAAMSINWVGMYMLNQMIGEQFSNQMGGLLGFLAHGIPTLLGFALLYLGCAWVIVNTSFNLITAFPRTILNWLSTSDPGHNAFDSGGHHVLGAVGTVQHRLGHAYNGVKALVSGPQKPSQGEGEVKGGKPKI